MIGNMFGVKDPVPGGLRSRVVYKFACAGCNASYVGEMARHFSTRVREHLVSDRASHVFKHHRNSEHCRASCSVDCFHILGPAQTLNFSCTEPNVAIKYMKSSTCESIRIGRFVFGSTVPFYPTGLAGWNGKRWASVHTSNF